MRDRLILLLRDQCIDQIIAGGGQELKLTHERIRFIALCEQLEAIGDGITDDDGVLIEIEHALILLQRETVGRGLCARLRRACSLCRGRYSTAACNGAGRCRRRNRRTRHRADLCQCREAGRGYHRRGQKCSGTFSETLLHKHSLSSMAAKPAVFYFLNAVNCAFFVKNICAASIAYAAGCNTDTLYAEMKLKASARRDSSETVRKTSGMASAAGPLGPACLRPRRFLRRRDPCRWCSCCRAAARPSPPGAR